MSTNALAPTGQRWDAAGSDETGKGTMGLARRKRGWLCGEGREMWGGVIRGTYDMYATRRRALLHSASCRDTYGKRVLARACVRTGVAKHKDSSSTFEEGAMPTRHKGEGEGR